MGNGDLPPPRPDQLYSPPTGGQAVAGQRASIRARQVLIIGHGKPPTAGLFVYDPAVALNDLFASITAASGNDPQGNAVLPGIVNYNPGGGASTAGQLDGGALILSTSAGLGGPWQAQGKLIANTSGVTLQAPLGSITLTCITGTQPITLQNPTAISSGVGGSHLLTVTQSTASPAATIAQIAAAAAGDKALAFIVTGDTQPHLRIDSDGTIRFGPGGTTAVQFALQLLSNTCLGLIGGADFAVDTVGNGLQVKEGASAKQGSFTLVAGAHTVANTTITANSRIFLTAQDNNSTGALRVSARVVGTSFTVTSSNAADSGLVAYEIFEPAP